MIGSYILSVTFINCCLFQYEDGEEEEGGEEGDYDEDGDPDYHPPVGITVMSVLYHCNIQESR